jgi:hypothetical protein
LQGGKFDRTGQTVLKSGPKPVDPAPNASSSCPQLTIDEPTSPTSSDEDESGKEQVNVNLQPVTIRVARCFTIQYTKIVENIKNENQIYLKFYKIRPMTTKYTPKNFDDELCTTFRSSLLGI